LRGTGPRITTDNLGDAIPELANRFGKGVPVDIKAKFTDAP
jgi:hypothetical protein